MRLTVIIPAFNEERRLPETLRKVRDYLENQKFDWEVLVVNDGSRDGTAEVVSDLIKEWGEYAVGAPLASSRPIQPTRPLPHRPRSLVSDDSERDLDRHFARGIPSVLSKGIFRLIDNKENKGKGAVVKQGMLEARGDWRLFMDADNSTDISEIEKLFNFSNLKSQISNPKQIPNSNDQNYEIIIGSRYLQKESIKIKQPLIRRMVSRIGNWLIRILLGIDMKDTQCGFKLFSAKAAEDIFPKQTIMRWGFDMEILAIAKHRGYKIKEVAVDWYDSTGSQVKKSAALKTLKELFVIKWNLMRGKYS